jgi:polyphosphate kinase
MTRNLDKRIEVIFPVYDAELIKEVATFLSIQLADNVKARVIDKKQQNDYKELIDNPVREQEAIYEWLKNKRSN